MNATVGRPVSLDEAMRLLREVAENDARRRIEAAEREAAMNECWGCLELGEQLAGVKQRYAELERAARELLAEFEDLNGRVGVTAQTPVGTMFGYMTDPQAKPFTALRAALANLDEAKADE